MEDYRSSSYSERSEAKLLGNAPWNAGVNQTPAKRRSHKTVGGQEVARHSTPRTHTKHSHSTPATHKMAAVTSDRLTDIYTRSLQAINEQRKADRIIVDARDFLSLETSFKGVDTNSLRGTCLAALQDRTRRRGSYSDKTGRRENSQNKTETFQALLKDMIRRRKSDTIRRKPAYLKQKPDISKMDFTYIQPESELVKYKPDYSQASAFQPQSNVILDNIQQNPDHCQYKSGCIESKPDNITLKSDLSVNNHSYFHNKSEYNHQKLENSETNHGYNHESQLVYNPVEFEYSYLKSQFIPIDYKYTKSKHSYDKNDKIIKSVNSLINSENAYSYDNSKSIHAIYKYLNANDEYGHSRYSNNNGEYIHSDSENIHNKYDNTYDGALEYNRNHSDQNQNKTEHITNQSEYSQRSRDISPNNSDHIRIEQGYSLENRKYLHTGSYSPNRYIYSNAQPDLSPKKFENSHTKPRCTLNQYQNEQYKVGHPGNTNEYRQSEYEFSSKKSLCKQSKSEYTPKITKCNIKRDELIQNDYIDSKSEITSTKRESCISKGNPFESTNERLKLSHTRPDISSAKLNHKGRRLPVINLASCTLKTGPEKAFTIKSKTQELVLEPSKTYEQTDPGLEMTSENIKTVRSLKRRKSYDSGNVSKTDAALAVEKGLQRAIDRSNREFNKVKLKIKQFYNFGKPFYRRPKSDEFSSIDSLVVMPLVKPTEGSIASQAMKCSGYGELAADFQQWSPSFDSFVLNAVEAENLTTENESDLSEVCCETQIDSGEERISCKDRSTRSTVYRRDTCSKSEFKSSRSNVSVTVADVTRGEYLAMSKGEKLITTRGDNMASPRGNNLALPVGGNLAIPRRGDLALLRGNNLSIQIEENMAILRRENTASLRGKKLAKHRGENLAIPKGENLALAKRDNLAIEKGDNLTVPRGDNLAIEKGDNLTVPTGENLAILRNFDASNDIVFPPYCTIDISETKTFEPDACSGAGDATVSENFAPESRPNVKSSNRPRRKPRPRLVTRQTEVVEETQDFLPDVTTQVTRRDCRARGYDVIHRLARCRGHGLCQVHLANNSNHPRWPQVEITAYQKHCAKLTSSNVTSDRWGRRKGVVIISPHSNLLTLLHRFKSRNSVYQVTEHCDWPTLAQLLQLHSGPEEDTDDWNCLYGGEGGEQYSARSLCENTCQVITTQMCHGLSHLHAHDAIHGDLNCYNILVSENLHVKLAGYGPCCQRMVQHHKGFRGQKADILSPPEVLNSRELWRKSADVWCLGLTLLTMLLGYLPAQVVALIRMHFSSRSVSRLNLPRVSYQATLLLDTILQAQPSFRPTVATILKHTWLAGSVDEDVTCHASQSGIRTSRDANRKEGQTFPRRKPNLKSSETKDIDPISQKTSTDLDQKDLERNIISQVIENNKPSHDQQRIKTPEVFGRKNVTHLSLELKGQKVSHDLERKKPSPDLMRMNSSPELNSDKPSHDCDTLSESCHDDDADTNAAEEDEEDTELTGTFGCVEKPKMNILKELLCEMKPSMPEDSDPPSSGTSVAGRGDSDAQSVVSRKSNRSRKSKTVKRSKKARKLRRTRVSDWLLLDRFDEFEGVHRSKSRVDDLLASTSSLSNYEDDDLTDWFEGVATDSSYTEPREVSRLSDKGDGR